MIEVVLCIARGLPCCFLQTACVVDIQGRIYDQLFVIAIVMLKHVVVSRIDPLACVLFVVLFTLQERLIFLFFMNN